jgi:hypothetical protein
VAFLFFSQKNVFKPSPRRCSFSRQARSCFDEKLKFSESLGNRSYPLKPLETDRCSSGQFYMLELGDEFSEHRFLLSSIFSMSQALENWRDYFLQWPADLQRRGIIVTAFEEQIPFSGFWISSNFLLLERQTPDSLGARTILLTFSQITALKIVDVIKPKSFQSLGFEGPMSKS